MTPVRWSLFSDILPADPAALPSEFRIFKAGENPSTKGVVLFDTDAAASVMAEFQRCGVDLMIDLEHQALDLPIRPDSADARGWFRLEVRAGELWAVDVKWAPDGARRLAEKTQRYISPAFYTDENSRVTELINVALVAMPATYQAAPLVAASKRGLAPPGSTRHTVSGRPRYTLSIMDPSQVKAALDAIEAGDSAGALEILKAMIASAAGAEATEPPGSDAMSDTAADPAADPSKDPAKDPSKEMAALGKQLADLRAEQSKTVVALRAEVKSLTDERDAKDLAERQGLVAELVKCGAEIPATAWDGEPEARKPAAHLRSMALPALRERVKTFAARGPITNQEAPKTEPAPVKLTKEQEAYCKKHNLTPEQFAARKASAARVSRTAPDTK